MQEPPNSNTLTWAEEAESKRSNLSEAIANRMRRSILQGAVHPGEHLCQNKLASEHGTSRAPVREALIQLHAEGLLCHDLHRGYFVTRFSWSEIRQIYRMRRWLETEMLGSLRWPEAPALARFASLETVIGSIQNCCARDRVAGLPDLRLLLFGLSREKVLLREAARLWARTDRLQAYFATEGTYAFSDALRLCDRALLRDLHLRERDEAEHALAEARSALRNLWTDADSPTSQAPTSR